MNQQILVQALLRSDLRYFVHRSVLALNPGRPFLHNLHIDAITYQLERVRRGEINRLIINLPPRYLKSLIATVSFPAFVLGHDPTRRIICLSYGADLAEKHAADCRAIMQSSWYQDVFPATRISRVTNSDIHTAARGFRKTTSVGGPLTGLGGDLIIIDDPQKPVDAQSQTLRDQLNQWFSNTLVSRLDGKERSAIIVVMQRVHLHDLTGYLLENSDDWTVLNLAAIAEADEEIEVSDDLVYLRPAGTALHPEYESLKSLLKTRKEMGEYDFLAQYQQAPIPLGGAMIKRSWLRYYKSLPKPTGNARIVQSWDCAGKDGTQNSWSVCTTWMVIDKTDYYLMNVTRGRFNYPQLRKTALALAERYDPNAILVEDTSAGIALAQELKEMGHYRVEAIPVERDKEARLYVQAAKFEAGHVHFPAGASFLPDLEAELLSFPQSKFSDQVDSITQALAFKFTGYDCSLSWV